MAKLDLRHFARISASLWILATLQTAWSQEIRGWSLTRNGQRHRAGSDWTALQFHLVDGPGGTAYAPSSHNLGAHLNQKALYRRGSSTEGAAFLPMNCSECLARPSCPTPCKVLAKGQLLPSFCEMFPFKAMVDFSERPSSPPSYFSYLWFHGRSSSASGRYRLIFSDFTLKQKTFTPYYQP